MVHWTMSKMCWIEHRSKWILCLGWGVLPITTHGWIGLLSASQMLGNAEVCLAGGAKPLEISSLCFHPSKAQPALPWCAPSRCKQVWASGSAAGDVQEIKGPGDLGKHSSTATWMLESSGDCEQQWQLLRKARWWTRHPDRCFWKLFPNCGNLCCWKECRVF